MIVKVKSFKKPDFQKLLEYMMNDDNRLYDKRDRSFILTHNLKGRKIERWVAQFKENETFRKRKRKDSVILTHEIISFHKDDSEHITVEKLREIAREYISRRNIKGMYVAVPHFDKEHYHIHICASGVEYRDGKSLRMSKAGFQKLKKDIQNYQIERYPELSKSLVAHDKKSKGRISEKEYQQKLRTGRATKKEQIIETLESCFKACSSKNEFYQKLKDSGLEIYERSGKTTGVVLDKIKFRFSRLGFPNERIEELEKSLRRGNALSELRGKKVRIINRNR
jgi:hypothetical protein